MIILPTNKLLLFLRILVTIPPELAQARKLEPLRLLFHSSEHFTTSDSKGFLSHSCVSLVHVHLETLKFLEKTFRSLLALSRLTLSNTPTKCRPNAHLARVCSQTLLSSKQLCTHCTSSTKFHVISFELLIQTRLDLRTPYGHCALLAPELSEEKQLKLKETLTIPLSN
jgi:hypothetical protein